MRLLTIVFLSALLCVSAWAQDSLNVTRVGQMEMSAQSLLIVDTLAYVAAMTSGLQIVNVSAPSNPTLLGSFDTPGSARALALSNNYAYIADEDGGLRIIDVLNPTAPNEIGCWDYHDIVYGVALAGNYACLAENVLKMLNVSNPTVPAYAGFLETPGYGVAVIVRDSLAYMAAYDSGLRIIRIDYPPAPVEVGAYDSPGQAQGLAIHGGLAYLADGSSGLSIVSVDNLGFPGLIGYYDTPGNAVGITVSGHFAFVADDSAGLLVLNVSNPASPTLAGFYNTPGRAWGVAVNENLCYVADYMYLGIYDVSAALGTKDSFILQPSSFTLSAYPNPFNATARIQFDVPRASFVNVAVYDLQGRLVDELASRTFEMGTHTLNYDAKAHASGVYVMQIRSRDFSAAQKLVLLK